MEFLKSLYCLILDLLFPIFCFSCRKEGSYLCADCFNKLPFLEEQACPVCHELNCGGRVCLKCRRKTSLDGLMAGAVYEENGLTGKLIKQLKYGFSVEVAGILGEVLVRCFWFEPEKTVLVPVPLYKSRLKWRGFNQALLLAKYLSKKFGVEVQDILLKTKSTQDQASLDFAKRQENVKNVFAVQRGFETEKTVVLIDDVVTTSATLNECAKVLKQSGVKEVWGMVVGR